MDTPNPKDQKIQEILKRTKGKLNEIGSRRKKIIADFVENLRQKKLKIIRNKLGLE